MSYTFSVTGGSSPAITYDYSATFQGALTVQGAAGVGAVITGASTIAGTLAVSSLGDYSNTKMFAGTASWLNGLTPAAGRQIGQASGVYATEGVYGGVADATPPVE